MNKSQYLADKNVKEFVNWLSLELKNKSLLHHYVMPGERRVTFTGLEDALAQYDWPFNFQEPGTNVIRNGNSFTQNDAALTDLKAGLDASLALDPVSGRDAQTRDWAVSVMGWGGVRNGNVSWLDANVNGLANEIDAACTLLESGNDDKSILRGTIRRFNAGMTKVYSLLVDDFIIYDSRVAAALTWLVVRWCLDEKSKQTSVPDMLCFPCMRPKEGDNPAIRKVRNPNCAGFRFPWMYGPVNHAHWNLRASWILSQALHQSSESKFHQSPNPLRALEAALFMWGYDLSLNIPCTTQGTIPQMESDEPVEHLEHLNNLVPQENGFNKSTTRGGKAKEFTWLFDAGIDSIRIDRGLQKPDFFTTGEIFSVIHNLYDHFGSDWYPLANNVEKMGNETEIMGLGSTIFEASKDLTHAQASSQLGVILEELGIFEWNNKMRGIAWRLCIDPPATIDDLRMALCNEPVLNA